jgi:transcriptional regulator with XRE-family HTH domain
VEALKVTIFNTLGLFLKEQREKAGLSLEEVSNSLTSTTVEQLNLFEDDAGKVPLNVLYQLANFLNADPDAVLALIATSTGSKFEPNDLSEFATNSQASLFINGLGEISQFS